MNTPAHTPAGGAQARRPLPNVRGEAALAILGLYLGIWLYYSKRSPWIVIGLTSLTLTALYLAYSLKYVNPTPLSTLNITRKRMGLYFLAGLLLVIPGWFLDSLLSKYLLGRSYPPLGIAKSPLLILSILAVAIGEEVFFRGYLLGRLRSLDINKWARIALVSALFMFYKVLVHSWEGRPLAQYIEFFAFGAFRMLLPTFWADWTGSIVTPIIVHIGWDLIMFQSYSGLPPWAL